MATVTLTQRYANLSDWPGRLLEADSSTTVLVRTGTTYTIRHGSDSEFAGFRIVVTGTDFTYVNGKPSGGTITGLVVLNRAGQPVVTISGIEAGTAASDLSLLAFNIFGSGRGSTGPGPDGKAAWSHLLAGSDTINGTAGDDVRGVVGVDAGNDTYNMGAGRDLVNGGLGNDTVNGGDGVDTLSFAETHYAEGNSASRGIVVNVAAGTVLDAWGFTDSVTGVESFMGSVMADEFIGGAATADLFAGLRGADRIDGGGDSIGVGITDIRDQASFRADFEYGGRMGIVADLQVTIEGSSIIGTVRDGFGTRDVLIDIERLEGTRRNDTMIGSDLANRFRGGEGRDRYNGMGGDDEIDFSVFFGSRAPQVGIRVNLALNGGEVVNDGFGNTETATSIEDVVGTNRADFIRGDAAGNQIQGMDGKDVLIGLGGIDTFVWTTQAHANDGDVLRDFTAQDRLAFEIAGFVGMTTSSTVENDLSADTTNGTFLFDGKTNQLFWDSNGSIAGGRSLVAIITGVETLDTEDNFRFWV